MAKNKVSKKDESNFLNDAELRRLESCHYEQRLKEKELQIAKLNSRIADLELKLFSANYTLKNKELEELKKNEEQKNYEFKKEKEKGARVVSEIGESKGLNNSWGYDPMTGEIK